MSDRRRYFEGIRGENLLVDPVWEIGEVLVSVREGEDFAVIGLSLEDALDVAMSIKVSVAEVKARQAEFDRQYQIEPFDIFKEVG